MSQAIEHGAFSHDAVPRAAGRYAALDADETLNKIAAGCRPDPARFEETAGGLVARAAEGGKNLASRVPGR